MYEKEIAVLAAIRGGVEKCKHHINFSKRIRPYIEQELEKSFPEMYTRVGEPVERGYIVRVDVEHRSFGDKYEILVWGKDIPYDKKICVSWAVRDSATLYNQFVYQCDICDPSDSAERALQEDELVPRLQDLENKAQLLLKQVEELRYTALHYIAALPIPKSAKVRNEDHYWNKPSTELSAKFPLLFDSNYTFKDEE